ncbi:MAG: hypothetical protein V3T25_01120 [Gemmatimonadota bacterium]
MSEQRRPDPLADIELLFRSRYPLILPLTLREWARARTVSTQ